MTAIKTLIFDLGKVLLDFDHRIACDNLGAHCGITGDEVLDFLFTSGLEFQYERGKITTEDLLNKFEERTGKTLDKSLMLELACNIFQSKPEMVTLLRTLKKNGYRLILLSNTNHMHWEYINKNYDFLDVFDHQILSFKVGYMKPELDIYKEALKFTQSKPEECFYTDDLLENILPARTLGFKAEQFTGYEKLASDLKNLDVRF